MRFITALLTFICVLVIASPASAKRHTKHFSHHQQTRFAPQNVFYGAERDNILPHPSGCPRTAFCGCGVSVKVFGHPVRNLFLASNWRRFPRTSPAPGMVAVRNHHVMLIVALDGNGNATVYDPNSGGHQTRQHVRSLSGYYVVNPNGSQHSYQDVRPPSTDRMAPVT